MKRGQKKKICVVTGTRAEYGLLYGLMKNIVDDNQLKLQLVVTGMHLSPEFGLTYKQIEKDGFSIDAKVEMLLSSDTPVGIAKSIGLGIIGFADVLDKLQPDVIVVLGDRYEILAAAQTAMVARVPIVHIHGGEATEGLIDEAIRHSITKMAHIHFTATEAYRKRVIQLGEHPSRVFNFGAIGLDNINQLELLDKDSFEKSIGFVLGKVNFLITFHPITLSNTGPKQAMENLFKALDTFAEAKVIFTKSNSDTDGRIINEMIDNYVLKNPSKAVAFTSLGQLRYLSAIKHVDIVMGNSSSGIIEVPFMKKPTINIGDRQKGRLKAESVVDCDESVDSIISAIKRVLSQDFQDCLPNLQSLYGQGNVSIRIKEVLKNISLDNIIMKKFYDL